MNKRKALEILGLTDKSTEEDIKKAYRKSAMKHHPDRGGDETKFKEMKEAYEFLTNPQPQQNNSVPPGFHNFADIFSQAFGQRAARPAGPQHMTYITTVNVTLAEAFEGCTKTISVDLFKERRTETLVIPAGIGTESVIKTITGDGRQGEQVELHFKINVLTGNAHVNWPHPQYPGLVTDVGDVRDSIEVDALLMITGGWITFTGFDKSTINLRVPEAMEAGKMLKVKGHGYWRNQQCSSRGDMYLKVIPKIIKLSNYNVQDLKAFVQAATAVLPDGKN